MGTINNLPQHKEILRAIDVRISAGKKPLFQNLNFSLKHGEKMLLNGDSGSGKSTLIHAILGFHSIDNGRFLFCNAPLNGKKLHDFRKKVAYIPQKLNYSFDSTNELLEYPFGFKNNKDRVITESEKMAWLNHFELDQDILDTEADMISGGEMQRILIISALMQNKELYLLDEPTSALDSVIKEKVIRTITERDITLLITSHDSTWNDNVDNTINI